MASKVLQVPQIIEIIGASIRVAHPNTAGNVRTFLRSPVNAGGTTLSVADNSSFANGDYLVVGPLGRSQTEETNVNAAVTTGSSLTVANTLKFAHDIDAEVVKIFERQIRIYGANTDGGSLTLITTLNIEWDKPHTEYTLLTTDTAYAYYVAKFYDGTTESSASAYIPSTGLLPNSVEAMIQAALVMANAEINEDTGLITRSMCVLWAQACQDEITQFMYQDAQNGRMIKQNWSFEVREDITSLATSENENTYSLSDLTKQPKYSHIGAILNVRIGKTGPVTRKRPEEFDVLFEGVATSRSTFNVTAGDPNLTLDDTSEFNESGSVYLGGEIITYTSKNATDLLGIPTSGSGSIGTTHSAGDAVWQNVTPGLPEFYTVLDGELKFSSPVSTTYAGQKIKIRYYSVLDRLTKVTDVTQVTFYNVFHDYLAGMIELRKGNREAYLLYMDKFKRDVMANALAEQLPQADSYTYHNIEDPSETIYRDSNSYYNDFA